MTKEEIDKKYRNFARDLAKDIISDASGVGGEALFKLIRVQKAKHKKMSPLPCIMSLAIYNIISAAHFIEDFYGDSDEKAEVQFGVVSTLLKVLAEQFPEIIAEIIPVEDAVKIFEMPAEKGVQKFSRS